MKNTFIITIFCTLAASAAAQVTIGKQTVQNTSTILDFDNANDTNFRGIILPAVANTNNALATDPAQNNGTFLFDRSDDRVKMYENNVWVNLSDAGTEPATINNSDELGEGAIIGSATTNAEGVLILESPNTAVVLPWIFRPHETVKSPYPGMMCYDTESRTLAVFDGTVWNYWK